MESYSDNSISIEIPNYSGPLEVLLDLAKTQKVDLANISITKLADQFLKYIKETSNLDLETASEYLLMATWLAYLKSKLLLPESDEDDFKASEVAEKLKLQLKKLELIRLLSDQMLRKKRIGIDVFLRGMKGGIRSIYTPIYDISLYELLKTYSDIKMQKAFQTVSIPKLPVLTTEEGIKQLRLRLSKLDNWMEINDLIPSDFKNKNMRQTGLAGIFAASLELAKEGVINIMQKKIFGKLLIKKNN
jgi:segregation and condensation protein A|tara:strand:+ start:1003 stop:1740 length:738 start_codon:yes stop_codon:yes gene_type:complete